MKRGQPYLGAFLLKDEQADSDVITDINSVHPVGVFAQITSVFAAASVPGREDEKEEGLTAVLYPHRRIKITDLLKVGGSLPSKVQVEEQVESTVPPNQEQLPTPPPSPQAIDPELPIDQAKHHPGMPTSRAIFPSQLTVSFSTFADLLPPGLRRLYREHYEPGHAALQQRRPIHPCVHVGDRIGVQGHRTAEPALP